MSTCTVATEDDFEAVEHNHVPNDGDRVADADDWTITDNPIPNSSSSNRKINHNLNVKVSSDDDEDDDGAPCSVVVVELPASMSQKATGIIDSSEQNIDSSEQNVTEFIRKEGNFEDDESLGVSSRSTIASSVIQKLEQWNTKGDSVADKSSNVTDQMKEKQPSITDVKNSDRRTCSTNTHSSNKWSLVEEEKRYRNSGRHENYSDTDYSSVSTWGTTTGGGDCNTNHAVVAAYKNDDDDRTTVSVMGASSTISGFDIISLNGTSSQRACHRCTYLNPHHSLFCEVCEVSLEPNPCPDADAALAQQLQDDEDKYAFSIVQGKETKRRHMFVEQPLIVQSRAFKRDIYRFMNDFNNRDTASSILENDKVGYSVLPEVSMIILASRFIETMIANCRSGKNADVLIRYCVTPKLDGLFHEKVKENAFPPNSIFSLEFELALRNNCKPYVTRALGMIPEGSTTVPTTTHFTTSTSLSDNLGWIAAIVKGEDTADTWNSDDKCYTRVPNPSQTLPLICFDASLWNTPATKYLFQGMIRVCNDFFDTMQEQIDEDKMRSSEQDTSSGKKKARVQETTSDHEVETADTASMANRHDDKNDDDPDNMEDNCTTYIYEDDSDDEDDDNDNHDSADSNPPPLAFAKYASSSIDDESDSE